MKRVPSPTPGAPAYTPDPGRRVRKSTPGTTRWLWGKAQHYYRLALKLGHHERARDRILDLVALVRTPCVSSHTALNHRDALRLLERRIELRRYCFTPRVVWDEAWLHARLWDLDRSRGGAA